MKLKKLVEETFQRIQKVNENIFTFSQKVEEKIQKVIKLWNWENTFGIKNASVGRESLMNLIEETIEVKTKSLINIHLVFTELDRVSGWATLLFPLFYKNFLWSRKLN